ncbi:hypothetical protein D9758_004715 [Tetrapyrgos nigripes]|uniref:Uncharacterized protein n=1 Tax=Tetrapyrgos nigripes TaxID=182062 RepID=A0A8H5H0I0_9AGAR|nr:hypothetical protein D9758_004715 [Tetrapyrgos nigripes]
MNLKILSHSLDSASQSTWDDISDATNDKNTTESTLSATEVDDGKQERDSHGSQRRDARGIVVYVGMEDDSPTDPPGKDNVEVDLTVSPSYSSTNFNCPAPVSTIKCTSSTNRPLAVTVSVKDIRSHSSHIQPHNPSPTIPTSTSTTVSEAAQHSPVRPGAGSGLVNSEEASFTTGQVDSVLEKAYRDLELYLERQSRRKEDRTHQTVVEDADTTNTKFKHDPDPEVETLKDEIKSLIQQMNEAFQKSEEKSRALVDELKELRKELESSKSLKIQKQKKKK